jgi:LysR family glycine cleavage system transcriptional activator
MRRDDLPSPNALIAFEAAARLGSVRRAATALGVTPAAVSRHVARVESEIGAALFVRGPGGMAPTREGRALADAVSEALATITRTVRQLRARAAGPEVTVASTVAFASLWLLPRTPRFTAQHPGIALRTMVSDTLSADAPGADHDLLVLYGRGAFPGFSATPLFGDDILPVASPAFLAAHGSAVATDLLRLPLIHLESPNRAWEGWAEILAAVGLPPRPHGPALRFNNYVMALQAAEDGLGIALGWRRLVAGALAAGRLAPVLPVEVPAGGAYHLLLPARRPPSAAAALFAEWLAEEARRAG